LVALHSELIFSLARDGEIGELVNDGVIGLVSAEERVP
jgi:hypothetical protein